jgi:hypothetical protein
MNPKAPGRPAITGRQGDGVWDFLSLSEAMEAESFIKYPHLTLVVASQAVEAGPGSSREGSWQGSWTECIGGLGRLGAKVSHPAWAGTNSVVWNLLPRHAVSDRGQSALQLPATRAQSCSRYVDADHRTGGDP